MARKKSKAKAKANLNGKNNSPPRHNGRAQRLQQEAVSAIAHQFSLRDEARYMSNHRSSAFDSSKKLRHMPVAFVSAGCLEGTVKEKPPQAIVEPALSTSSSSTSQHDPLLTPSPVATDRLANMTLRSPSPASSTDSASSGGSAEERIVFRGRGLTPSLPSKAMAAPSRDDAAPSNAGAAPSRAGTAHSRAEDIPVGSPTLFSGVGHSLHKTKASSSIAGQHDDPPRAGSTSYGYQPGQATYPAEMKGHNLVVSQDSPRSFHQAASQGFHQAAARRFQQAVPHSGVPHSGVPHSGVPHSGVPQCITQGVPQGVTQGVPQVASQGAPQSRGIFQGVPQGVPQVDAQGVSQAPSPGADQNGSQGTAQGLPRARSSSPQQESDADSNASGVVDTHFKKRRGGRPRWEGYVIPWVSRSKPGIGWLPVEDRPDMEAFVKGDVNPRDAATEDYMQNAEAFGLADDLYVPSGFARREMDLDAGSHNDWIDEEEDELEIPPAMEQYDGSGSDELRGVDGNSPSFQAEGAVDKILGKRTETDHESDSDFDSTSDGFEDDEQYARFLQRQEKMGLAEDESVSQGAAGYFGESLNYLEASGAIFGPSSRWGQRRTEPKFPSASAMADALDMDPYAGFDIMDAERPSLRPRKKGRRGQLPLEVDDPDMNEQIRATWEADRAKKRLKKAEREELRKQGLLGRKGKGPDLKVKYKGGFVMEEVIDEIRNFMASDAQTLSLPAMEAHRRAVIHQFMGEFGVNSKSHGDGANRHTVLSKTKRTVAFDDDSFDGILAIKKYRRRLQVQTVADRPPIKKRKSVTRPVVSYRDGEVVGAKASELGPENKGRAMLEKMGWSKGMALGAVDNKGILQPITHTVKITKAGLR